MAAPSGSTVALRAMDAVQRGAKAEWLALFGADARLDDPVGAGAPRRGTREIEAFWDAGIAPLEAVRFDVRRVHDAPGEAIVLADVSIRTPGGASAAYDAAIHYRLDDDGRIGALRAFWDPAAVMAQLAA